MAQVVVVGGGLVVGTVVVVGGVVIVGTVAGAVVTGTVAVVAGGGVVAPRVRPVPDAVIAFRSRKPVPVTVSSVVAPPAAGLTDWMKGSSDAILPFRGFSPFACFTL